MKFEEALKLAAFYDQKLKEKLMAEMPRCRYDEDFILEVMAEHPDKMYSEEIERRPLTDFPKWVRAKLGLR